MKNLDHPRPNSLTADSICAQIRAKLHKERRFLGKDVAIHVLMSQCRSVLTYFLGNTPGSCGPQTP